LSEGHFSQLLFNKKSLKTLAQDVVPVAFAESVTKNVVMAAFRNTGLVPFDANVIRERTLALFSQSEIQEDSTPQKQAVPNTNTLLKVFMED
jgi:hypothetical protein